MFVDQIKIRARAGDGGNGCVAFRREKCVPKGGPSGGDGGKGGDVVLLADESVNDLSDYFYKPNLIAGRGGHGLGKKRHGKNGADCVVKVPRGTIVRRADTNEAMEDLVEHGQRVVIARGGRGGLGNWHFRSATHQTPRESTPGGKGEAGGFILELKTIADVGLVGYPNAGKSTLLSKISAAHPKIAPYPFTTRYPAVGVVAFDDYHNITVADIPGLIEGAHDGFGLGHEFLRHIERCKTLLLLLDMAGVDGRDPRLDYEQLLRELELHNPDLLKKPRLIVANKMDLPAATKNLVTFRRKFKIRSLAQISAEKGSGLGKLLGHLHSPTTGLPAALARRGEAGKLPKDIQRKLGRKNRANRSS